MAQDFNANIKTLIDMKRHTMKMDADKKIILAKEAEIKKLLMQHMKAIGKPKVDLNNGEYMEIEIKAPSTLPGKKEIYEILKGMHKMTDAQIAELEKKATEYLVHKNSQNNTNKEELGVYLNVQMLKKV